MPNLTGSANCIKYVLFAFNFAFVITGIILICVGGAIRAIYEDYELFLILNFFSIPTLLIVTGAFIFVISFFGCCGAIKESYCMVVSFSVLLGLVFILELAGGISGYVLHNKAETLIEDKIAATMVEYDDKHLDIVNLWDAVQQKFECCGLRNATDWIETIHALPMSCCAKRPAELNMTTCYLEESNKYLFRRGCLEEFSEFIRGHVVSLGVAGIVLAVIQITGIILISVGVTVAAVYEDYELFLVSNFFSIPTLLIVTGAFIFVIAFFGCCGAIKENYCMIFSFSVLLGLIFILELAGGISGYVLRNDAETLIKNKISGTMVEYDDKHLDIVALWDGVQRKFECCGLQNGTDWMDAIHALPMTCCAERPGATNETTCYLDENNKYLYTRGCLVQFSDYISAHAVSLGAAGVVLAVIQFVGIFFACYIAREIKIKYGGTGPF